MYGWSPNGELSSLTLYRNFEDTKIGRRANLPYEFYDDREVDTPPPPVLAAVAESLDQPYAEEVRMNCQKPSSGPIRLRTAVRTSARTRPMKAAWRSFQSTLFR